jgi:hypothetical protein
MGPRNQCHRYRRSACGRRNIGTSRLDASTATSAPASRNKLAACSATSPSTPAMRTQGARSRRYVSTNAASSGFRSATRRIVLSSGVSFDPILILRGFANEMTRILNLDIIFLLSALTVSKSVYRFVSTVTLKSVATIAVTWAFEPLSK